MLAFVGSTARAWTAPASGPPGISTLPPFRIGPGPCSIQVVEGTQRSSRRSTNRRTRGRNVCFFRAGRRWAYEDERHGAIIVGNNMVHSPFESGSATMMFTKSAVPATLPLSVLYDEPSVTRKFIVNG